LFSTRICMKILDFFTDNPIGQGQTILLRAVNLRVGPYLTDIRASVYFTEYGRAKQVMRAEGLLRHKWWSCGTPYDERDENTQRGIAATKHRLWVQSLFYESKRRDSVNRDSPRRRTNLQWFFRRFCHSRRSGNPVGAANRPYLKRFGNRPFRSRNCSSGVGL